MVVSTGMLIASTSSPTFQARFGKLAIFGLYLGGTLLIPGTVGVWERIARPWVRRLYGAEGQLGSGNIQRARVRTTLTVAALMVGASMILTMRGMTTSYEHDIRTWVDSTSAAIVCTLELAHAHRSGRRIEGVEGVASATPVRYLDIDHIKPNGTKERLVFMAVDPESYSQVTSFVFASNQGDANILFERLAGITPYSYRASGRDVRLQARRHIRLETRAASKISQLLQLW